MCTSRPFQSLIGRYLWLVVEEPALLAVSSLRAGPRHGSHSFLPRSSCRRGTGSRWRLGTAVWVPSGRWWWGCCGCWLWPSPAAGGRWAARVRRCEAASAAPRPETLRARASATSSSTVGGGAGWRMKARGHILGAVPPPLAWGNLEPGGRTENSPSSPGFNSSVARSPPAPQLTGIVGCVYCQPHYSCSLHPC